MGGEPGCGGVGVRGLGVAYQPWQVVAAFWSAGGRASISSHRRSLLFVPYCLQWRREPAIPSLPYWQRETYLASVLCTGQRACKINGVFHLKVYETKSVL